MPVKSDREKSQEGQATQNRSSCTAVYARGDFDARPQRKKRKMNLTTLLIVGGIGLVLLIAVTGIMMTASSHMSKNNPIDESRVKADVALQRTVSKDEAMKNFMTNKEKEEIKVVVPPPTEPSEVTPSATVKNTPPDTDPTDSPPRVQIVQDGGIFPTVPRFQSKGLSVGAVGGHGERQTALHEDADIAQINAFANAPPAEFGRSYEREGVVIGEARRGSLSTLSGTGFAPSKAQVMPSRQFLVTHNTYTRCALYTAIITDQPGLIECRLTEPLYSSDGSVVIAEAGDKLTGEQKVEVRAGQTRVFTSWTELETASGVRAKLDSLGAGAMGASGTAAWIDHHYRQRFGGAVMLSFIQDALRSAANATQKGNHGYTVNNSEQNVESMANKALDNSINIPPTAYILPGTVMTVIRPVA